MISLYEPFSGITFWVEMGDGKFHKDGKITFTNSYISLISRSDFRKRMIQFPEVVFHVFLFALVVNFLTIIIRGAILVFHKKRVSGGKWEPVSIVISARNEAKRLEELVSRLMDQDYPEFELIICLDRCSDNSLELCKKFENEYSNFKIVIIDELPNQFSPKKFALTLGIKAAKNEWILLTDADCTPFGSGWITSMAENMDESKDFVIGCAPHFPGKGILNHFIHYETFNTAYEYLSSALLKIPYMGVGRNLAFRKSLFLKVNGYNRFQGIMGGDDDLFLQYHCVPGRLAIAYGPSNLTFSEAKTTFKAYWYQKKRHLSVSKFYKLFHRIRLSLKFTINLVLWVSFFILAFNGFQPILVISLFLSYLFVKSILNWAVGRKIGTVYNYLLTPVLELIYITFLPITGLISTFTKKVKWN